MKRFGLVMAMMGLMVGTREAAAGPIFTIVSLVNVAADPTLPANPPGFGAAVIGIGSSNSVTFTTNLGINLDAGQAGGAPFTAGTIFFSPAFNNSTPINFATNFNYQLIVTDQGNALTGTVNLTGTLSGTANGGPSSAFGASFSNLAFSQPVLTLGADTFAFGLGSSTPPFGGGGVFSNGVLQIVVSEGAASVATPEPSTLAGASLAGLGALVVARRRKAAVA